MDGSAGQPAGPPLGDGVGGLAPAPDEIGELIAHTALGDRRAFSRLYDRTSAKLFGVCLRILRERMQAEDALQEIYVKVWRNAATFSTGRASGMTWLISIARNQSIDMLRARIPQGEAIDAVTELADERPDPERAAASAQTGARIDACLDELKPERADAVRSAYVEGYSYNELAERHSVPLNTMKTWIRRGLLSLRDCLERP